MADTPIKRKYATGTPLLIITGLSGAGKSTAMRAFEDLGCYCADNLPPELIPSFFDLCERSGAINAGVVIASDVRSGALFDDFVDTARALEEAGVAFGILYLDAATDVLINRFSEVRRAHPLEPRFSIQDAIEEERRLLEPIRAIATHVIDTSALDVARLREAIVQTVAGGAASATRLKVMSFGYKYGVPRDADFVFDVRFLPNPFYVPELKDRTGQDPDVFNYVMSQPAAEEFFQKCAALVEMTLDGFVKVGKYNLAVAFGCTGGRHRSVAFAERLASLLSERGHVSRAVHRDAARVSK
jgi:RNase adapter protein RapZ